MNPNFYGADVAELRRVAKAFENAEKELETAATTVTRGVQSTFWVGPVAVKFRATWEEHKVGIGNARGALIAQAKVLYANADAQEKTSKDDGKVSSSTGSGIGSGVGSGTTGGSTPAKAGGAGGAANAPATGKAVPITGVGDLLGSTGNPFLGSLGRSIDEVLSDVPGYKEVRYAFDIANAWGDPGAMANAMVNIGADYALDAIKHTSKLGYLVGVTAQTVREIADITQTEVFKNADWSGGALWGTIEYAAGDLGNAFYVVGKELAENVDRFVRIFK